MLQMLVMPNVQYFSIDKTPEPIKSNLSFFYSEFSIRTFHKLTWFAFQLQPESSTESDL